MLAPQGSSAQCSSVQSSSARNAGSPHARVATAAAGALSAAAATCGPTLEPHLDRFLAALFGAAASPRPDVAAAACQALAGVRAQLSYSCLAGTTAGHDPECCHGCHRSLQMPAHCGWPVPA
jgi:hypothetical protein